MNKKPTIFNRQKLYEQIWKEPISRIAPKYEISDTGLAKICKVMDIPRPSRGYWTRLQFKKPVTKDPLPPLRDGVPETYEYKPPLEETKPVDVDAIFLPFYEREFDPKFKIKVPSKNKTIHHLLAISQTQLKHAKPGMYGLLHIWGKQTLRLKVGPKSVQRALRIMNTLLFALEKRQFKVSTGTEEKTETWLHIKDEKLAFSLEEKVDQTRHILTDKEREDQALHSWSSAPVYDHIPSGKLFLKIDSWYGSGMRKKWSDTKTKCLEDQLNEFCQGAVLLADQSRKTMLQHEKDRQRRLEEQRRKEKVERQRQAELARRQALEIQAEQWTKSQHIHAYIQAVEAMMQSHPSKGILHQQFQDWLSWAKTHAERLDPLKGGLPFGEEKLLPKKW